MKFNPDIYRRRSIRLKAHDYSQAGAYFVTVCTWNKECLFGKIVDGTVRLSPTGKIARNSWLGIPDFFENAKLDEFIVMPNHIHGIVILNEKHSAGSDRRRGLINQTPTRTNHEWILMRNPRPTLGKILRHYKARTSKLIHDRNQAEFRWQRNYYEHVVRDDAEINRIREYIAANSAKWLEDEENPDNNS